MHTCTNARTPSRHTQVQEAAPLRMQLQRVRDELIENDAKITRGASLEPLKENKVLVLARMCARTHKHIGHIR